MTDTQRTAKRQKRQVHDPARIVAARAAAGLSQIEVTRRAGLASGTLSKIENSEAGTTPETLVKIADAIGCPVTQLLSSDLPTGTTDE